MNGGFFMFNATFSSAISLFALVEYICFGIACMNLAKNRGIRNGWIAWIPVIKVYMLGKILDSIHADYNKKSNRRILLLVLSLVSLLLVFTIIVFLIIIIISGIGRSELPISRQIYESFMYFGNFNPNTVPFDISASASELSIAQAIIVLIPFISAIIFFIVLIFTMIVTFITYYGIYKEYAPDHAALYIIIAILLHLIGFGAILPIILLCIYKNTPSYKTLT